MKSWSVSIIIILNLRFLIAFGFEEGQSPEGGCLPIHYSITLCSQIPCLFLSHLENNDKMIKTLPVLEICSWKSLNIGLILPITSCCQGNDLRREAAPLHILWTCFAWKDSQLLVVHPSAILSHLPPSCLTKGNIRKASTGGQKCRQGKQKG